MSIYMYFPNKELACRCGCGLGQMDMHPEFMAKLVWVRRNSGIVMPITSAIRCKDHNRAVSTTGDDGPHTTGRATDIKIYGSKALQIIQLAVRTGMTGIDIKQKGPKEERFIHLDDLESQPRPWIWSY